MSKQSPKTTNTAIRIPTDIYEKIENQPISEGTNVSTVINQVIRKYLTWDQFVGDIGCIFIQKPFLKSMFEEVFQSITIKTAKTT